MTNKLQVLAAISGGGTTLEAVLKHYNAAGNTDEVEVVGLVHDRDDAMRGVDRATALGFDASRCFFCAPDMLDGPDEFGDALWRIFREVGANYWAQLGWLKLTPANFIHRVGISNTLNQHPGKIDPPNHPGFGGRGMHGVAVHLATRIFMQNNGDHYWTESTMQEVDPRYDCGRLKRTVRMDIDPMSLPLELWESAEIIAAQLLPIEHANVIETLRLDARGEITPHVREERLVRPDQVPMLELAKKTAIKMVESRKD